MQNDNAIRQPSPEGDGTARQPRLQVSPRPAVFIFNEGSQYFAAHNFRFTADEEKAIRRACREAEKFMLSYGQGEQPPPLIDPAHAGDYIDYRIINPPNGK